jgi:hypothetical protein
VKLYIEVNLDQADGRRGDVIRRWFDDMASVFFTDVGDTGLVWHAGVVRSQNDAVVHFTDRGEDRNAFSVELQNSPFWAEASLNTADHDLRTRIRAFPPLFDNPRYISLSANVTCTDRDARDEEFATRVALSVAAAAAELRPVFGRIELGLAHDRTNLDIGLRRRPSKSLPESGHTLRGYAWVTIVPEEILSRLGGVTALDASGVFCRVRPLAAGGALLQSSPTIAGYTDAVMEGVFRVLAPVLPAGVPSAHVAFPGVRFVARDADDQARE